MNQLDLTDNYRTIYPTSVECTITFFSNAYGMCTMLEHIRGHKTSLDEIHQEFQKIEMIQSMFSDHNETKLEINKIFGKSPNIWKLNSTLVSNHRSWK